MKTKSMLLPWMPEVQRMLHDKSVIVDSNKSFPVIPKRWWELDPGHWLWMEGFLTSHLKIYKMCLSWKKKKKVIEFSRQGYPRFFLKDNFYWKKLVCFESDKGETSHVANMK